MVPSVSAIIIIHNILFSTMFNLLNSIANQQLFEKLLFKVNTMKNTDNFCFERKPLLATTKLTPFAGSKDEWDTKEDTGKSMKNVLYALQ